MTVETVATEERPVAWRDREPEPITKLVRRLAPLINASFPDASAMRGDGVGELLVHVAGAGRFRLRVELLEETGSADIPRRPLEAM